MQVSATTGSAVPTAPAAAAALVDVAALAGRVGEGARDANGESIVPHSSGVAGVVIAERGRSENEARLSFSDEIFRKITCDRGPRRSRAELGSAEVGRLSTISVACIGFFYKYSNKQ